MRVESGRLEAPQVSAGDNCYRPEFAANHATGHDCIGSERGLGFAPAQPSSVRFCAVSRHVTAPPSIPSPDCAVGLIAARKMFSPGARLAKVMAYNLGIVGA